MADTRWVKLRSWHAVSTRWDGGVYTRCGRAAKGDIVDALPAEKSCETCLRIVMREADR
jgi:hypothetical protein